MSKPVSVGAHATWTNDQGDHVRVGMRGLVSYSDNPDEPSCTIQLFGPGEGFVPLNATWQFVPEVPVTVSVTVSYGSENRTGL